MRIATWNVNSINARLEGVLAWFESEAPEVAVLQEIKCVDEKFRGRVVVRTDDRDQVMHPQSSCWRRKRSNSAARSSALGILDSARRS